jgi:hypothetical protein
MVALILVLAVVLRIALHMADGEPAVAPTAEEAPPATQVAEAPTTPVQEPPAAEKTPVAVPPPPSQAKDTRQPLPETRPQPAPVATGNVRLQILPWGEVHVNGEKLGVAPPLRDLPLKAGTYRIEIHNPGFAPYREVVEVSAGKEIRIRHQFR